MLARSARVTLASSCLLSAAWSCSATQPAQAPGSAPPLAHASSGEYGFRGFEIYRVGAGTSSLLAGDFDGDGLADLALVDNRRSRIELLRRLPKQAPDAADPDQKSGPNQARLDGRFERRRIPVERRILQLALGDWNQDKHSDLAWVEEGGELSLLAAPMDEKSAVERRTLEELRKGCSAILAADITHDGKQDLLLACSDQLLALVSDGKRPAERLVLDSWESAPSRVWFAQLDGKAGEDLLYAYLGADAPLRWRLNTSGTNFGPRAEFDMPQLRSAELAAPSKDGRRDVLGIYKISGRLSELAWDTNALDRRPLLVQSLGRDASKDTLPRGFCCGDLDLDGASDVVVSEPGSSQVTVWYGRKGARGLTPVSQPSLSGATAPHLADVDGDGKPELVLVSASEHMLGLSHLEAGRALEFPRTVPIQGEPVALDLRDLDGDSKSDAVLIVAQGEGRNRKHRLEIWNGTSTGFAAAPQVFALDGLKKTPTALQLVDLDHDGDFDALAYLPGESAVPALILAKDGGYVADERGEDAPGLGVLAGASPRNVSLADVDHDGKSELVVAHANFARALAFGADAVPRVVEQFNAPADDARISAARFVDMDGDGKPELVLRDDTSRDLLVTQLGADGLTTVERVFTGRIDFGGLDAADFDGDGRPDLLVYGRNGLGLVYGGARSEGLVECASYEPGEERVVLDQIACAELGGGAPSEIVVSELSHHALVILRREAGELAQELAFETYEKKTFEQDEPEREPREIVAADFDGDGKQDLAVLVHDKLILYLQE
ncbi:MAG: VCBS repeat-containing protein [Planctomycetes bacterium]|nr:VCBS repeat-containing protein [Planctomycetota bacterium]